MSLPEGVDDETGRVKVSSLIMHAMHTGSRSTPSCPCDAYLSMRLKHSPLSSPLFSSSPSVSNTSWMPRARAPRGEHSEGVPFINSMSAVGVIATMLLGSAACFQSAWTVRISSQSRPDATKSSRIRGKEYSSLPVTSCEIEMSVSNLQELLHLLAPPRHTSFPALPPPTVTPTWPLLPPTRPGVFLLVFSSLPSIARTLLLLRL